MITIIDYGAGNVRSVQRALDFLAIPYRMATNGDQLLESERLLFPGVGSAGAAMEKIQETDLAPALRDQVASGVPMLGICLGTQIIFSHSQEDDTPCLGLLEGEVLPFHAEDDIKVPHMGWNTLQLKQEHPLFQEIPSWVMFYFVHSYYPEPKNEADIIATTEYQKPFASVVGRNNLIACQFHPEKSGKFGLQVLKNFNQWKP